MNVTGQTALITGASSGIGEAYAREFAARGADLILVARSEDRLRDLADQLGTRYGREVTVLPADLQVPGAGDALARQVHELGLTVDILVNNAGFGMHGRLAEADPDRLTALIQLNCVSLVDITRRFLPGMLARRRGIVINVASTASFQPLPFMATYGASKAFVLSFTEALWAEARPAGVKVIAVCPGATETRFFEVVGTDEASVGKRRTPEQVVATTFAALRRGRPSVVDGRANALLAAVPGFSPRRLVIRIAERTMRAG
jgi:short-subunit dehydrogenase